MKIKTEQILTVLKVIAWIAMIGFSIEAGSKIISFVVSYYNPEASKNLYKGLDFYELRKESFGLYLQVMSFIIILAMIKVEVWIRIIQLFSDLNLQNPFKKPVVKLLERIGYSLLSIWVVGFIANIQLDWIGKRFDMDFSQNFSIDEYLFISGIVYIISQIFKRGVELQEENELTV